MSETVGAIGATSVGRMRWMCRRRTGMRSRARCARAPARGTSHETTRFGILLCPPAPCMLRTQPFVVGPSAVKGVPRTGGFPALLRALTVQREVRVFASRVRPAQTLPTPAERNGKVLVAGCTSSVLAGVPSRAGAGTSGAGKPGSARERVEDVAELGVRTGEQRLGGFARLNVVKLPAARRCVGD